MVGDERGYWPPYVGKLWDATAEGSSESVSTVGHGVQVSRVEDLAMAEDGRGHWPFDTDGLRVLMEDAAIVGHSTGKSTNDARSHLLLLNNRECTTPGAPTVGVL